jgi:hypothetical protein
MEEPASGPNHGRQAPHGPDSAEGADTRWLPLATEEWQAAEFMRTNGWTMVHSKDGTRAGINSHVVNQHTVLHPDEHVDMEAVGAAIEDEFGFTFEQLHSVYSTGGRIPSTARELRDLMDARLLALSRSGANMDLFGRITGLNESTLDRALARARAKEEV